MRKVFSIIFLFAFACWNLADANVKIRKGGKVSFAAGGKLFPGPTPENLITGDTTATMTSATAPSPNVVTYSNQSAPNYAWQAFDGSISAGKGWIFVTPPGWLKYNYGTGNKHAIKKMVIKFMSSSCAKTFGVYGSNDDSNYTNLASGTFANNAATWQAFTWTNDVKYQYIRLNIADEYNQTNLAELEYWEQL